MIAKCRAKCFILHLREESESIPNAQRGLKGNIIVFPQRTSPILDMLPPPMQDVVTPICVLFVGSSPPTPDWLRQHARPLVVRREKIRDALLWLQEHNYLYRDVVIDQERIASLDDEHVLPVHIETMSQTSDKGQDILTSRYDSLGEMPARSERNDTSVNPNSHHTTNAELSSIFEHVVVTDVDANSPSHQLRAAALRHVKDQAGGYIQVPHSSQPVNEFVNPELFPLMYPTLFPYGVGGFENPRRSSKLALKRQVKHFLNLADCRFQEHNSFLFIVFNMLQRRTALLHTSLKVKGSSFNDIARGFASISSETVHRVAERVAKGDLTSTFSPDEQKVRALLKQVNSVTSHVPGSGSSRSVMRNPIRGLMIDQGLPNLYGQNRNRFQSSKLFSLLGLVHMLEGISRINMSQE
ncbi:hypothetical protein C8R48DRAFT_620406 [Suillus tomentosus]|nr:hypothetical protein C8R48DRAFT_620406 [Suillus tomentosus]